jgi:hypothetical protein
MRNVSEYSSDDKIISSTQNIGNLHACGINTTSVFSLNPKWQLRIIGNANFSNLTLTKNIYTAFTKMHDINGSVINRYNFSKKSDGEIGFRIMNYYQGLNDASTSPMFNLSFQFNHKIADGKWVISFLANDILFTMKNRTTTYPSLQITNSQEFIQRSRYFQGTLRYKFGSDSKKRVKKIEEERLQFSNG